jgi:hypothetical protein
MTINSDLFLAILSLDSYNREYGANIALTGTSIGNVSIVTRQSLNISAAAYQNWQSSGFYALSYTVTDGTISELR